jgi:hypothetical protein
MKVPHEVSEKDFWISFFRSEFLQLGRSSTSLEGGIFATCGAAAPPRSHAQVRIIVHEAIDEKCGVGEMLNFLILDHKLRNFNHFVNLQNQ